MKTIGAALTLTVVCMFECGPPKETGFKADREVRFAGQLLDSTGTVLPGIELVLGCSESQRRIRTDNLGNYDFGVIGPGDCRVGIASPYWLPPKVKCDQSRCWVDSLRLNPKGNVTVY
jgi:hypothetical protein